MKFTECKMNPLKVNSSGAFSAFVLPRASTSTGSKHLLFLSAADGAVKKEGKGRQFRKRNPAKKGHKVGRGGLAGHRRRARGARGPPAGHGAPKDPCLWSRTLRPGSSPPTASWSTPTTSSVSFIRPTARDTQACGLLLLNPDPVIVDPYEEARVIGKCLSRALDVHTQATTPPWTLAQRGAGSALRPLLSAASRYPDHAGGVGPWGPDAHLCSAALPGHHSQVRTSVVRRMSP